MVVLNRRCLLGFAVAGVLVPTVRAQTPAVESMLRRFSREVKCAEGSFEQKAFARDGKIRETFSGTFAFLRPGRFVWQYEKPYRQSIISNGKTLWMYDEDLMQVTMRPLAQSIGSTPAAILFGNDPFGPSSGWTLNSIGKKGELVWVECLPKTSETISRAVIGFDSQGLPSIMTLVDAFGLKTELHLSGWKFESAKIRRCIEAAEAELGQSGSAVCFLGVQ